MAEQYMEVVSELGQVWVDTTDLALDAALSREEYAIARYPSIYEIDPGVRENGRQYTVMHER